MHHLAGLLLLLLPPLRGYCRRRRRHLLLLLESPPLLVFCLSPSLCSTRPLACCHPGLLLLLLLVVLTHPSMCSPAAPAHLCCSLYHRSTSCPQPYCCCCYLPPAALALSALSSETASFRSCLGRGLTRPPRSVSTCKSHLHKAHQTRLHRRVARLLPASPYLTRELCHLCQQVVDLRDQRLLLLLRSCQLRLQLCHSPTSQSARVRSGAGVRHAKEVQATHP